MTHNNEIQELMSEQMNRGVINGRTTVDQDFARPLISAIVSSAGERGMAKGHKQ